MANRRGVRIIGWSCLALLLLASLFVTLTLSTDTGRRALLSIISALAAGPDLRVEARDLDFNDGPRLGYLAISDATGIWLEARNIVFVPELWPMLRGKPSLRRFSVAEIRLERLPGTNSSTAASPPDPMSIQIRQARVERLLLGQHVFGQQASLAVHGGMRLGPDKSTVHATITRQDRADAASLAATLTSAEIHLALELRENPGGLLHSLLDLSEGEGITARVAGHGPRHACPIQISASVSRLFDLAGNATLALTDTLDTTWDVRLDLGAGLLRHAPNFPPTIETTGRARWRKGRASLSKLELRNQAMTMSANATWENNILELKTQGTATDLAWLMPKGVRAGKTEANATLRLDPRNVTLTATTHIEDWAIQDRPVSGHLNATCALTPDLKTWRTKASAVLWQQRPDHEAIKANATLAGNATAISLEGLNLSTSRLHLDMTGGIDERVRLDSDLKLRDLSLPGTGPLRGRVQTRVNGVLENDGPCFSGRITASAEHLTGLPEVARLLIGPKPELDAAISISPDLIRINPVRLAALTTVTLHGEFHPRDSLFSARFKASRPELQSHGMQMQSPSLDGNATGTPSDFAINLAARARDFSQNNVALTKPRLWGKITGLPERPHVDLAVQAQARGEALDSRIRADWVNNQLVVANATLSLPGTHARFSGLVDPVATLPTGTVILDSERLDALGRALGLELRGALSGTAHLTRDKSGSMARFQGQASRLSWDSLKIGSLNLDGIHGPDRPEATRMNLVVRDLTAWNARADHLAATITGTPQGLSAKLTLDHDASRTKFSTAANVTFPASTRRVEVHDLHGHILGQKLHLSRPLRIDAAPNRLGWNEIMLGWGAATIRTSGQMAARNTATVAIHGLDLNALSLIFPDMPHGQLDARLELAGSDPRPELDLRLDVTELRVDDTNSDLPPLAANITAGLRNNTLSVTGTITTPRTDMRAKGDFSCPVKLALKPLTLDLPPSTPITGSIAANPDLSLIPRLLRLDAQSASGQANLHFRIGGSLGAPTLTGSAQVANATYENHRTGTRLTGIQGSARADNSTITLALTGADDQDGRVETQATIDLQSRTHAAAISLRKARLLRLDSMHSTIDGILNIRGQKTQTRIRGDLTLDPSEYRLPRSTPANLPDIDVTRINAPATQTPPPRPPSALGVDLDIGLNIPGRFFVTGRGLNSEWSGAISIQGAHVAPRIAGTARLIRGRFEFLDRIFNLTQGSLSLDGSSPPNPYLDVTGQTRVLETTAMVHLHGPAKNFRVSLSSNPVLPADEILALILFGRSSHQISPLQAVRLAGAAAELTGIGATPEFFGAIKKSLGLQEITVDKDEDDATNVGLGGYVGDTYYVRTQRSVSGQDKTKVEIQLTPRISVETEIGADSRQGGGVTWKHEY